MLAAHSIDECNSLPLHGFLDLGHEAFLGQFVCVCMWVCVLCASVHAHRLCVYVRVYVCCVSVGEGMSVWWWCMDVNRMKITSCTCAY